MKLLKPILKSDSSIYAALAVVAAAAIALTALAVYSFVVAAEERTSNTLASYQHTGNYTYSVSADPSALNPAGMIGPFSPAEANPTAPVTPPAIFTRLAHSFNFTYAYEMRGQGLETAGEIAVDLQIKAGDAWTETRPLVAPQPFQGTTATVAGSVNLGEIAALLQQIADQTGVNITRYDLIITPTVTVSGSAGGQPVEETFSAPFTVAYTSTQITPGETLSFAEPKTISSVTVTDKTLFGLPVTTLRLAAPPLAAVALLGAGLLAAVAVFGMGRPEPVMTRLRYRSILVPVSDVESTAGHRVSVASIHDLAQMAKRESRPLFVKQFDEEAYVYFVHDGMVIYQHAVGEVPENWVKSPLAGEAVTRSQTEPVTAAETDESRYEIPSWLTEPYDYEDEEAATSASEPVQTAASLDPAAAQETATEAEAAPETVQQLAETAETDDGGSDQAAEDSHEAAAETSPAADLPQASNQESDGPAANGGNGHASNGAATEDATRPEDEPFATRGSRWLEDVTGAPAEADAFYYPGNGKSAPETNGNGLGVPQENGSNGFNGSQRFSVIEPQAGTPEEPAADPPEADTTAAAASEPEAAPHEPSAESEEPAPTDASGGLAHEADTNGASAPQSAPRASREALIHRWLNRRNSLKSVPGEPVSLQPDLDHAATAPQQAEVTAADEGVSMASEPVAADETLGAYGEQSFEATAQADETAVEASLAETTAPEAGVVASEPGFEPAAAEEQPVAEAEAATVEIAAEAQPEAWMPQYAAEAESETAEPVAAEAATESRDAADVESQGPLDAESQDVADDEAEPRLIRLNRTGPSYPETPAETENNETTDDEASEAPVQPEVPQVQVFGLVPPVAEEEPEATAQEEEPSVEPARPAVRRRPPPPLEQRVAGYVRRWLRDFLEYPEDGSRK